jgi:hypothetical protein
MIAYAREVGRSRPEDLADLEVIELPEPGDADRQASPPREPLRWLVGEGSPAQASFARGEPDLTGTAGIWRALGALRSVEDDQKSR